MRSVLRQNLPAPAGTFSCSRAHCYTCSFLNSATSTSGSKSNFVIRHNFTCTSSNIIYCISCSKYCKFYIGETGRRLSARFAEHLRSVRNNDVDKPVARHFNAANHSISDIKVCTISPISGGTDSRRRQEKSHFENWNHSSPRAQRTIFLYLIPSYFLFLSNMGGQKL